MDFRNLKQKIFSFIEIKARNFHYFVERDVHVSKLRVFAISKHHIFEEYFFHIFYSVFAFIFLYSSFYFIFWRAPSNFQDASLAPISKGAHLNEIADAYENEHIIRSSFWLKFLVVLYGGEKKIIAGDYYFSKPISVFVVARRILNGDFGLSQTKVVLHEGLNSKEMGQVLSKAMPWFDGETFAKDAKEYEGYLFPDTYFITQNQKSGDLILMMRENFARKTENLSEDLEKFGKPLDQVVIMASIVEDEAGSIEDKRIVSGILWKRLKIDMPLQVDSTLRYVNGKESHELTKDELVDKDNPYNTYANKGLPPTPIGNPGLDSLRAAVAPTNTSYLYFLSDKFGKIHYAKTFEEHKRNRELYL